MTGTIDLEALLRCEPAMADRLLQNCRLSTAGREAFGGEQIIELLRACPFAPCEGSQLAAGRSAAFVGTGSGGAPLALFAELNDNRFTGLWLMSNHEPVMAAPPGVSVPVDHDLDQRGPRPILDASEHPELSEKDAASIAAAWEAIRGRFSTDELRLARVRATVLRAFSSGGGWAAMLRIAGGARSSQAGWFALLFSIDGDPAKATLVQDVAGARTALATPWQSALRT